MGFPAKMERIVLVALVMGAMGLPDTARASGLEELPLRQLQPLADLGWDTTATGEATRIVHERSTTAITPGRRAVHLAFSLGGLKASEPLQFSAPFAAGVLPVHQPCISAFGGTASGTGTLTFSVGETTLGSSTLTAAPSSFTFPFPTGSGTKITVSAPAETSGSLRDLQLEITTPEMSIERWALLVSYAKLARNFSPATGLVRDRTTLAPDTRDAVPASGMFALAAAAMADAGFVDPNYAHRIFREVSKAVALLPNRGGMLPHFAARRGAAGSEFSTIDTAIYYHAMLAAAAINKDNDATSSLHDAIRALDFTQLRLPGGHISHGYTPEGDIIPYRWRDWGGESALVVSLERMAHPNSDSAIATDGRIHQGVGFIAEIASLFYPHFDLDEPDAVTGKSWKRVRLALAHRQRRYTQENSPDSPAARAGYFGYSAGDGREPGTYGAFGSDVPGHRWIHPHYLLMATAAHAPPAEARATLGSLVSHRLLRPWGLVEGFDPHFKTINAANVSLNAAFETLATYHLHAALTGGRDAIYRASKTDPLLRAGVERFYPNPASGR